MDGDVDDKVYIILWQLPWLNLGGGLVPLKLVYCTWSH